MNDDKMFKEHQIESIAINFKNILSYYNNLHARDIDEDVDIFMLHLEEKYGVSTDL